MMLMESKEANKKGYRFSNYDKNILGHVYSEPGLIYFEPIIYKDKYLVVKNNDEIKLDKNVNNNS